MNAHAPFRLQIIDSILVALNRQGGNLAPLRVSRSDKRFRVQAATRTVDALLAAGYLLQTDLQEAWHQRRNPAPHWHKTLWTVAIDPPEQSTSFYRTSTKALAEVYLRGLKENNPGAAKHARIVPPLES
jgi:hypothetical protein